ncbi:hypothetical protein DMB90_10725 [Raoultella planticola]|uniref:Uncharacterized protein n=1 Tax=Raoultella planticola TaxID=575 RepID=A0A5P6A9P9_RAOPL|nr:hypothetical protein DMB90_10725 [Raoultella planticola]
MRCTNLNLLNHLNATGLYVKIGDEGKAVAQLVDDLRKLSFGLAPTDKFDQVVKVSRSFPVANVDASGQPLIVDGKVGPHTRWALDAALGKHSVVLQHPTLPTFTPSGEAMRAWPR